MGTPNRNYFEVVARQPPRERDLNDGFIDKVDVDMQAAFDQLVILNALIVGLKERVDAVISDDGTASSLIKPAPEFQRFSTGTNALSAGNTPHAIDGMRFSVTGDWRALFTRGRALQAILTGGVTIVYVQSATYNGVLTIVVTEPPGWFPAFGLTEIGVSAIQYGAPEVRDVQIADGSLPPSKFSDPPASAAALVTARDALQAQINEIIASAATITATVIAHVNLTADVHGVTGALESTTGAAAKVAAHEASGTAHAALVAGMQPIAGYRGAANGYCDLDGNARVPAVRLPPIGLKAVYRDTTQMVDRGDSNGQGAYSSAFPAVVLAKSFCLISVRGNGTIVDQFHVTAEFGSTTQLYFYRDNANADVWVSWQVVEMY